MTYRCKPINPSFCFSFLFVHVCIVFDEDLSLLSVNNFPFPPPSQYPLIAFMVVLTPYRHTLSIFTQLGTSFIFGCPSDTFVLHMLQYIFIREVHLGAPCPWLSKHNFSTEKNICQVIC